MSFKQVENINTEPVKKPTILMMSDCPLLNTGMAVVLREIALGLYNTGKYNIVTLGWGHNGYPQNRLPFPVLPASAKDFGKDGFPQAGIPSFSNAIEVINPDIVWALGDAWMLNWIKDIPNRNKFKYIQYMPIDGQPVPEYWINWLTHIDKLVTYSNYGVSELKKASDAIKPEMIYHGTHPERYAPLTLEQKQTIKQKLMYSQMNKNNQIINKTGLPKDAFIVGTIARNQPRKNFDRILKSFSEFSKDKPNAYLWLHAAIEDAAYNLAYLSKMFKIEEKVCFTPNYNLVRGISEVEMNYLMNCFDVHFLPCQGEGFGLPILETMSAGVPQVVTDYTSHVEWAKDSGLMIPVNSDDFMTGIPHPVERALPKVSECVKCLNELYYNTKLREALSKNARLVSEKMTWDVTIPQWTKLIDELLNKKQESTNNIIKI